MFIYTFLLFQNNPTSWVHLQKKTKQHNISSTWICFSHFLRPAGFPVAPLGPRSWELTTNQPPAEVLPVPSPKFLMGSWWIRMLPVGPVGSVESMGPLWCNTSRMGHATDFLLGCYCWSMSWTILSGWLEFFHQRYACGEINIQLTSLSVWYSTAFFYMRPCTRCLAQFLHFPYPGRVCGYEHGESVLDLQLLPPDSFVARF